MAEQATEVVYMEGTVSRCRQVDIKDRPASEGRPARKAFSYLDVRLSTDGRVGKAAASVVVALSSNVDKADELKEGSHVGVWVTPRVKAEYPNGYDAAPVYAVGYSVATVEPLSAPEVRAVS